MLVLKDLSIEIPGTNMHYIGLDEYSQPSEDTVLLYGYNNLHSNKLFDEIKGFKRKIYFNVTMPTEFCSDQDISLDDKFDEVYTICPYSVKWLNKVKDKTKYKFIWYPLNERDIPTPQDKVYDVCYHGGMHGQKYTSVLQDIMPFNYRYMTMTHGINQLTQKCIPYATDLNLSNEEKMERIAQCKISVCMNSFTVRGSADLNNIKSQPSYLDNNAFIHAEEQGLCPQIKSRMNEAAACKTLNLVEEDLWNIAETFYRPYEHFLYFERGKLTEAISEVLDHWDIYKGLAESAHKHFKNNYTTKKLYHRIKNDENTSDWI